MACERPDHAQKPIHFNKVWFWQPLHTKCVFLNFHAPLWDARHVSKGRRIRLILRPLTHFWPLGWFCATPHKEFAYACAWTLKSVFGINLCQASILEPRIQMLMILCSNVGPNFEKAQPSMVLACSQVHIWTWHTPNHGKTVCFRGLPAPRSTASPIFMRKWTGCREWSCFLYYFASLFSCPNR